MDTTFQLKVSYDGFKRWDIIRGYGSGEGIVIRVKNKGDGIDISVFPYEKQDNKIAQFVWFWCLKLCVFLRLV